MAKYMDALANTGNIGFGLGLAATQIGLFVSSAAANLLLDCLIATKKAGKDALNRGLSVEQAIEQRIYNAIEATQELAKNPTEKLTEHANTFLDVANSLSENILGLPRAVEDPESSLKDRVSFLAQRIAGRISSQTNDRIVAPLSNQMALLLDQLTKCLFLVDYVKQRQEWTFNKVSQLSTSVVELRNKIEMEAERTRKNPGEVLLNIIRLYSSKLNDQLTKMRDRSAELLSTPLQKQVQAATMYVQQLDDAFVKAKSIEEVKQEVIEEAKHKLNEIARTSVLMLTSSPKDKRNGKTVEDEQPKMITEVDDQAQHHQPQATEDDGEPENTSATTAGQPDEDNIN